MNDLQLSTLLGDISKFAAMAQGSHENKDHAKAQDRLSKLAGFVQLAIAGYGEYLKIKGLKEGQ